MDTTTVAVTGANDEFGAAVCRLMDDSGREVLASSGAELPQGFERADIVVLAHGASAESPDWMTCSTEEWRAFRARGLDSVFTALQTYANARVAVGQPGVAIIVTSDSSHAADGSDALASAVSWGVRGLVRNASAAYARKGVRVNAVCADGAEPADVAALCAFLAQGEHITGQTIPVAGGRALL